MHHLHTVYDFHNDGLFDFAGLFPLAFVAVGLGVVVYNFFNGDREGVNKWGINNRKFNMFFGGGFALFALSMSAMVISSKIGGRNIAEDLFNSVKCKTVTGTIANYHPMPATGHESESFTVDTVKFEFYGNTTGTPGYSTPAVDGGVIKKGLFVRLTYADYYDNKVILKIETE